MIQARDPWLVSSDRAKQFDPTRANIGDLQCRISQQLILHAGIELLGIGSAGITVNHVRVDRAARLKQRKAVVRRCSLERIAERLARCVGVQEEWRGKVSQCQIKERWSRIENAISRAYGQPARVQRRPGWTDARGEIVLINTSHYTSSNSGYARQAILWKRISRLDDACGGRAHGKAVAVHFHARAIKCRIEAADPAL